MDRESKLETNKCVDMEKEIVCYCSNVSKETILDAIKNGAKNLQDISACPSNLLTE